jgi:hypothetical protein
MAAAGAGADLVTYVAAGRAAGPPRDHAERVAAGVATALDLPLVGLLAPAGGPDLGLARQRRRAAGAPAVRAVRPAPRARRRLAGGRVLVVDDLATTGATLAGAAAALRAAGARRVEVAVLGAAPTALGPAPAGAATPGASAPPARGPAGGRDPPGAGADHPGPRTRRPARATRSSWPLRHELWFCPGSSWLSEAALCGCDLFPCVESGQYDPRAV